MADAWSPVPFPEPDAHSSLELWVKLGASLLVRLEFIPSLQDSKTLLPRQSQIRLGVQVHGESTPQWFCSDPLMPGTGLSSFLLFR